MATRQEYEFQYTPLEGRLPGSTFEQQTEDAINDIGNRVATAEYNSETAIENSETAMQTAQEAKNTADDAETTAENAQASADTANDAIAMINNTLTEIDWTQSFTDENGVLYQKLQGIDLGGVEEETLSETASRAGQTEIANAIRGLSLELLSNNVLPFSNVAKMKETDVPVGSMAVTKGYYAVNDGGASIYTIRAKVDGGESTDDTTAYTKTVPANMERATMLKLGGKTVLWNQLMQNGNFADGTNGWEKDAIATWSVSDNVLTVTGTPTGSSYFGMSMDSSYWFTFLANHKYYISVVGSLNGNFAIIPTNSTSDGTMGSATATTPTRMSKIFSWNTDKTCKMGFRFIKTSEPDLVATVSNVMVVDLTRVFGAGNEPTEAEFEALFPADYYEYNAGELLSAGVTSVVSNKSNNATLQTYSVPASVQGLLGYGWSCPNHYNYIDFESKKFVQEVGSRAYASGDESDSTVITDGTTTYYPLNSVVETDVSSYLVYDNTIRAESGGTITFKNQLGDDYRIPISSKETFSYGDADDGGSIIFLTNGNVAELMVDGTVNVKQYGAYGDGTHNDTTAIQKAFDYAYAKEQASFGVSFPVVASGGYYLVTDTVWLNSSADLTPMVLVADGTQVSTVLRVGSQTGVSIYSKIVKLPKVENYQNGAVTAIWHGSGTGVEIHNVQNSEIYVSQIYGFTNGLIINPYNAGNGYNNYFLEAILYCKVCMTNTGTGTGWANENIFNNGRFVASNDTDNSWTGTRNILWEQGSNCLFVKPSIESFYVEYSIEVKKCTALTILQARYEGVGSKRIAINAANQYDVNSLMLIGGYQMYNTVISQIGDYPPYRFSRIDPSEVTSGYTFKCVGGVGYSCVDNLDDNPLTEYRSKLAPSGLSIRTASTDDYDKIELGNPGGSLGLYFPARLENGGSDARGGSALYAYSDGGTALCVNRDIWPRYFGSTAYDINLGSASAKWANIYATNGTIQTSDEREKQDIAPITDAVFRAWAKVNFVQFRFKDAVSKKGDKARIHFGLIAQQVKEAFESEGLNAFDYGLLCYDEWDEDTETDEDGNTTVVKEAGNRYGIRYDEALALECAYQRWLNKKA